MTAGCLQVEQIGDVTVVRFTDCQVVDEAAAQLVGHELFELVEVQGHSRLLLNMADVGFLTSTGLGKLVMLHKKLRDRGGEMHICGLQPQIKDIFTITKLDSLFALHRDEKAGLAAFAGL